MLTREIGKIQSEIETMEKEKAMLNCNLITIDKKIRQHYEMSLEKSNLLIKMISERRGMENE